MKKGDNAYYVPALADGSDDYIVVPVVVIKPDVPVMISVTDDWDRVIPADALFATEEMAVAAVRKSIDARIARLKARWREVKRSFQLGGVYEL